MKAEVDPLHVVVGAALLLMVFVVLIVIYTQFIGDEVDIADCQIANLKEDCDKDGRPNAVDECPCLGTQDPKTCAKLATCIDKDCKCK